MLAIADILRIKDRSGEELKVEDFGPIIGMLRSSKAIERFDNLRKPKGRRLMYDTVQMLTLCLYMEVRKMTLGGVIADLSDIGGQKRMEALGMPFVNGKYRCPTKSWMSDFMNKVWPGLEDDLEDEVMEMIVESQGEALFTCDSTPLEASRYSERCPFNPHYDIRMDKCHMIMCNGHPVCYSHTPGTVFDGNELKGLLDRLPKGACSKGLGFVTDGNYDGIEHYVDVYLATGMIMTSNCGVQAVIRKEGTWENLMRRYNSMWKNHDYRRPKDVGQDFIIRYLCSHGERKLVGMYLRNQDLLRKEKEGLALDKARHVCETVHHAMKRWLRFDVRGLIGKNVRNRIGLRFFFAQILSFAFADYQLWDRE